MIWIFMLAVSVPSLSLALQEGNQCPRREDIEPCTCRVYRDDIFIECKYVDVYELRKAFVNLRGYKNVHINIDSFYMTEKIPSDLFKGLDVITLEFHEIERIGDEGRSSLEGLEDTLQRLYIWGKHDKNPLEFLNITALKVLHALHIVIHNVLELGNDLFAKYPSSLKQLEIRSYQTREIGDKVFEKFVNLKDLCVIADIVDFRRSMLPSPATYLEHLDLSFNRISSLPEDMFVDMPFLRTVTLDGNRIAILPEATWSAVWSQLEKLYLDDNPLECDKHIEWMFRRRRPMFLDGTCEAPEHYKGKELKTVIEEKSISSAWM